MRDAKQPTTKYTVAYLKKRNFQAKLPKDFVEILSIENKYGRLPLDPYMAQAIIFGLSFRTEYFRLGDDKIYFSGNYSNIWIVRLFQKLIELINPTVYRMRYISKSNVKDLRSVMKTGVHSIHYTNPHTCPVCHGSGLSNRGTIYPYVGQTMIEHCKNCNGTGVV